MTDELKWGLLVSLSVVSIACIFGYSCNNSMRIHSQAPVVESCIKHPATRSPIIGTNN